MSRTALILGASGKIGSHTASALWNAGWSVRPYVRGTDMTAAATGCELIVNGLNPPNYHDWAKLIPEITAAVIDAARASGARVLIPGNVYTYGTEPAPWGPDTPQTPVSRKGRIRVEMEAAYREAGIRSLILRAGDFIDPERNGDVFSRVLLRGLGKGRFTHPGDPDARHAWCFVPDWARAAAALVERPDLPAVADIPFAGLTASTAEIARAVEAHLGRSLRHVRFPWILMSALAPVWELARELKEMRYLWEHPHSLDPAPLAAMLPRFRPTPLAEIVAASVPLQVHPDQPMRAGSGQSVAAK